MAADKVEVVGLKELRAELRSLGGSWPKELRTASKEAAELVADKTRASFAGGRGSAPKAASTVKALAQQTGAAVRIGGGAGVGGQVAMGNEFGSFRYRQFPGWRGSGAAAGYHLYPTIRDNTERVVEVYGDALGRLTKRAFPD